MKALHKLFAVLTAMTMAIVLAISVSADATNGISVSKSDPDAGDTFTVTLYVPAAEKADTMSVRAEFDSSAFEVRSWSPEVTNSLSNYGDGFFTVTSANAQRVIDLSGGLTMKAEMAVKTGAKAGGYKIKLTKYSISYVKDNGYEFVELWTPAVTEVSVAVGGVSAPAETEAPAGSDEGTDTGSAPAQTKNEAGEKVPDNDKADNAPAAAGGNDDDPEEEEIPVSDDDDDETTAPEAGNSAKESSGGSGTGKITISLDASLDEMPEGKVSVTTKKEFFEGDAVIVIKRPDSCKEAAANALENLGYKDHDSYAFDITVYDKASGKKIDTLESGYIEITIPLPLIFSGDTSGINVYHTGHGFPQRIASEIKTVDGQKKITFKANTFSPYMIADVNGKSAPAADAGVIVTVNDGAKEPGVQIEPQQNNYGKPLNPSTGVAAAVVIPAAMTCCVILARKQSKKRRRAKRRDQEDL